MVVASGRELPAAMSGRVALYRYDDARRNTPSEGPIVKARFRPSRGAVPAPTPGANWAWAYRTEPAWLGHPRLGQPLYSPYSSNCDNSWRRRVVAATSEHAGWKNGYHHIEFD